MFHCSIATCEFSTSKPDGWPLGDCQVEVMLDGRSAGSKIPTPAARGRRNRVC